MRVKIIDLLSHITMLLIKNSPNDYITFQIIVDANGVALIQYNDAESTYPVPIQ